MGKALSLTATAVEYEAAYNNRAIVPEYSDIFDRWYAQSQKTLEATPPQTFAYGTGERQKLDWFEAFEGAPVAVFMHGGNWQSLGREWFSFVATALNRRGITVVIPGYDLAPEQSLGRILGQVRQAVDFVRQKTGKRPLVFGHSAGGHMAAAMLSEGRARAALAMSGIFDLQPLVHTTINKALGLDAVLAKALSPLYWPVPNGSCPGGTQLDCWVSSGDSNEYIRQSREIAAEWGGRGADTHVEVVEGVNHFTMLDVLSDENSPLVKRLVELATEE